MATNPWFTGHNVGHQSEQALYDGMVIECIQWSGQDYYYIPRTLSTKFDQIFGEDVLSSFDTYALIEMYVQDISGYGGESEMLSKFGLEVRDTATFIISRTRFNDVVVPIIPDTRNDKLKWRPCEGDLIFAPFSHSMFEIKFVEDEAPGFYQLNKKYVWSLRCELVQLNNEKFNTGIADVDDNFNLTIDRLNTTILQENGDTILTEDGGVIMTEDYDISKPYDDLRGYGDTAAIKKEFMEIMDFTADNPFNELY